MKRSPLHHALCLLTAGLFGACARPFTVPAQWTLVWSDEFDGAAGVLPDTATWRMEVGTGWGNEQLECDTDRASNASLDGAGHLAITARRETFQGCAFTAARLTSQGKRSFRYGRIEARLRLPSGRGVWPAFWMLGASFPTAGWPASGEIDVMEFKGQEPGTVHGTVHGPGYSGAGGITRSITMPSVRLDEAFHVFAVEWSAERIQWFVDGMRFHEVTRADVPGPWVFDQPFHLLLNVAVGGTFVGSPDERTQFPTAMLVDWVRVSQRVP